MDQSERTPGAQRKAHKAARARVRWIVLVFFSTIFVSAGFTLLSDTLLNGSGLYAALAILLVIVLIGIVFDVVGVAVTAAEERPLHSMAAKKVPGAKEAIALIKNADRVASICNDVVGDICGVVSGSASAVIAARLLADTGFSWPTVCKVGMSAMVAGLTVGGKAAGKGFALRYSVTIVHLVGRVKAALHRPFSCGTRKNRKSSR